MQTTYSIDIAAPVAHVFRWLTHPKCVVQWVSQLLENQTLQQTPNRVGTQFRQVYGERNRRPKLQGVVTAYELNRRLAMRLSGRGFDLDVDYRLEDLHQQTRLTQAADVRLRGFVWFAGPLIGPRIRRTSYERLQHDFARLKELCEGDRPPLS